MSRTLISALVLVVVLAAAALVGTSYSPGLREPVTAIAQRDGLEVWSVYEGRLESRRVAPVMSKLPGGATLVELRPEGTEVSRGDWLARFDCSALERERVSLERDYQLARLARETLEMAELPLQLQELELELAEQRSLVAGEKQYLQDSISLQQEGLVSEQEVERQRAKLTPLRMKLKALERKASLAREHTHPAALERARAREEAARQERDLVEQQLDSCTATAPVDGVVIYNPVHVSSEFRPVRVGDTLYQNQPFLLVQDLSDLVVHIDVPESELARIRENHPATITPLSFPDLRLRGAVEQVGAMARTIASRPSWQKFFQARIGLTESSPHLRANMTVTARVLSYRQPAALVVPRTSVSWRDGQPFCTVLDGRNREEHGVTLGMANATHYEVIAGLDEGTRVVLP